MNPIENEQYRINLIQSMFGQIAANPNRIGLNLQLPVYVHLLRDLPLPLPIVLATEVEAEIWLQSREKFQSASLWLETFLLGCALPQEAYQLPMVQYEPFADFLRAYFQLTVAVHVQTVCPEVLAFPSPADLWFYSCVVMSADGLAAQGLTDTPLVKGKRETINRDLKEVSDLRELSLKIGYTPSIFTEPVEYVVLKAQRIASTNKSFHTQYLLPYLRVIRRSLKKLNESKEAQFLYRLPDGKRFRTGEKKKLPVSKTL